MKENFIVLLLNNFYSIGTVQPPVSSTHLLFCVTELYTYHDDVITSCINSIFSQLKQVFQQLHL